MSRLQDKTLRQEQSFIHRCVSDILSGLADGLSHFSGPSRAALVYAMEPGAPIMVCDPQNLLRGHEPLLHARYQEDDAWRHNVVVEGNRLKYADIHSVQDLGMAGLISHGGYSGSVFFQRWFTEHHPDMCSTGPTERWLEHAVWRFSHDMAQEKGLYTGISGLFLKEYATHAVRDHIVDAMNVLMGWDSKVRVYPVLDAILMISETREEGNWPDGELIIVDPSMMDQLNFLLQFGEEERPRLAHYKHVRKLLQTVERSSRRLVSDGRAIWGICDRSLPQFSICADFRKKHGFLRVNRDKVCSFADGRFSSTTYQAKLVQLEELLLESELEQSNSYFIFKIIVSLVHQAQRRRHGCAMVIDLNDEPVPLSGQTLSPPLDLRKPHILSLTKSLARVDGALHIGADGSLYGFACLMDGKAFSGEDRARGARYNSALRFTAEHDNVIVVVVSSDRPVSIIKQGVEVQGQCHFNLQTDCTFSSKPLDQWAGM